jgi:hypothetical protein
MKYNVYVQDKFYKVIEAQNTGSVLSKVSLDIKNGLVPNLEINIPNNIRVEPINE